MILVAIVCVSGCTDNKNQMPPIESTATNNITPVPELTHSEFQPLGSHTPNAIVTTIPTSLEDPIIGYWKLNGASGYSCHAIFAPDNTGLIDCSALFINLANERVTWEKTTDKYTFMRSYNVTRLSTGNVYSAQYSNYDNTIVSEFLPDGSYLQRA